MKIKESKKVNSILTVTLIIEKAEFDKARMNAYMDNTSHYVVLGVVEGAATLEDLMRTYGPAVLYDEALDQLIPMMFTQFLKEQKIRIMGRPTVADMTFEETGEVVVTITAECFPEVTLGQYKGLTASIKKEIDPEQYDREILEKACRGMKGAIPVHMIEQKLDSMLASEKIHINQDAIYHLLADTVYLLKKVFKEAGVNRPEAQIKATAMDIMLQTVSFDNQQIPEDYLIKEIRNETSRYRDLPEEFTETIRRHIQNRKDEKARMTPEELTEEAFEAYLGSLGLTVKTWRKEREIDAAKEATKDLLYSKVAEVEHLNALSEEVNGEYERLAEQYGIEFEKIVEAVPNEIIQYQILRNKAKKLILESAC